MRKRQSWQIVILCAVVAGLFLSGALLPFAGQTDQTFARSNRLESPIPTPEVEEEIEPYIQMYADALDISYTEAKRRLALQGEMGDLQSRVITGESAIFAGTWIQHQPEFRLLFAFKAPNGAEIIQPYLEGIAWADLVKTQEARYTLAELETLQDQIIQIARTVSTSFASGLNIPEGKVRFYTPDPEELRSQLEALEEMQAYLDLIEYIKESNGAAPASSMEKIYFPRIMTSAK